MRLESSEMEGWEGYKHIVEDFTKAGIQQESWGKRLSKKDLKESFQQSNQNEEKIGNNIAGFSSSDDDDLTNPGLNATDKIAVPSAKRACVGTKRFTNKSKRHKKYDEEHHTKLAQHPQRTPQTIPHTTPDVAPHTTLDVVPHSIPDSTHLTTLHTTLDVVPHSIPDNTHLTTPHTTLDVVPHSTPDSNHLTTPHTNSYVAAEKKSDRVSHISQKANMKKWQLFANTFQSSFRGRSPQESPDSSASSSYPATSQEDLRDKITWSDSDSEEGRLSSAKTESPVLSQDRISLSTQHEQSSQVSANIDDFDSDHESCTDELINKECSPSIGSNTPTPTPTPCTPNKQGEHCPPLNSTKKVRKQKYLRGGLSERLHKITLQENFNKTFWHHQTQQKRDEDDESSSTAAGDFLRVRVLSERLDHNVYIVRCHVLSREFHLPKHVIVLLDSERRRNLDNNITSLSLRIYSPWKILHLPKSSQTVIMNMAHCELIPSESLDLSPQDISDLSLEEVTHSDDDGSDIDGIHTKENERQKGKRVVNWPSQDFLRDDDVSMTTRVNITARVQRVFWRNIEVRPQNVHSRSSLISQIIQNAKILKREKRMSLCCLVQGISGSFCEVLISEDLLVKRRDCRQVLCRSEGAVLSFSQLRLVQQRNRNRARQMFSLIDSLKETSAEDQSSCFTFTSDEYTSMKVVSQNSVSDYPGYYPPESLNLNSSSSTPRSQSRAKVHGKLLHARFTSDKFNTIKHFLLWVSGRFTTIQDSKEGDLTPAISVIQVRYSSCRTVEWNETTLLPGQLLSMQDLVYDKAKPRILTADIFSKIQLVFSESFNPCYDQQLSDIHEFWRRTMSVFMTEEEYTCLKSQSLPVLPNLSENCGFESLVIFEGTISGVDEENAFCWFSCPHCSSEDISEHLGSDSQCHCNSCSLDFNSPITNMNLEVYMRSRSIPQLNPKVKLLQRSIKELLSGSQKDSQETYHVDCVMGKHLGPLHCCIVEKTQDKNSKISFKLEELDNSSWST